MQEIYKKPKPKYPKNLKPRPKRLGFLCLGICLLRFNGLLYSGLTTDKLKGQIPSIDEGESEEMSGDEGRAGESGTVPAGEDPLSFLRSQPQFAQMRALLQQNPSLLAPLLQQLAQSNPQLLTLINEHQSEFYNMINEPMDSESSSSGGSTTGAAPAGQPPASGQHGGRTAITVTPAEREAIDRVSSTSLSANVFARKKKVDLSRICFQYLPTIVFEIIYQALLKDKLILYFYILLGLDKIFHAKVVRYWTNLRFFSTKAVDPFVFRLVVLIFFKFSNFFCS